MITFNALPPEVHVVQENLTTTRLVLPRRDTGKYRILGWCVFCVGIIIAIFMIFWMYPSIASGLKSTGISRWAGLVFGLTGLPGLAAGLGLIGGGIVILKNLSHAEIRISDGEMTVVERAGPLFYRRRISIASIGRLVVHLDFVRQSVNNRPAVRVGPQVAMIVAETKDLTPFWMVPLYPPELLKSLAASLAGALAIRVHDDGSGVGIPVVVHDYADDAPEVEAPVPKPGDTTITVIDRPDAFAVSVPPAGIWKGSKGLFLISLLWNGFMVVVGYFTLTKTDKGSLMSVLLFDVAFFAIGIGMLLGAVNMGRRRIMIAVVNGVLTSRVIGIFRTVERKVAVVDITSIGVGPSGMEVNNQPVMELQITHTGKGGKIGLLRERTDCEQQWVAYLLRQKLQKPQSGD